jgi:flagellar hook assembly protein FlgD
LKIFDLSGRLVTSLSNEEMQAGNHLIKWDINTVNEKSISSGIYLLRIEASNFKETKKVFVIK